MFKTVLVQKNKFIEKKQIEFHHRFISYSHSDNSNHAAISALCDLESGLSNEWNSGKADYSRSYQRLVSQ